MRTFGRLLAGVVVLGVVVGSGVVVIPGALADDNPATDDLAHWCEVVPGVTVGLTASGVPAVVAGETVSVSHRVDFDEGEVFQDIFERPDGTTYWASYVETVLPPTDLVLDPASVEFSIEGAVVATVAGTEPDPVEWVLDTETVGGATIWRVLFPGDVTAKVADEDGHGDLSYTVPAGGETFEFTYDLTVPAGLVAGEVEPVAECFASVSTGPSNRDTGRLQRSVSVIEPLVEIVKTSAELAHVYTVGNTVSYDITVSVPEVDGDGVTVAAAYDVSVFDVLPDGLTVGSVSNDGVVDAGANTIRWMLPGPIEPGTSQTVSYDATIVDDGTVMAGDVLTNAAQVTATSMAGDVPGEHITAAVTDSDTITVASLAPSITKLASIETIDIGVPFTYTVTIDVPAGSAYENLTVLDTLPDGISLVSYDTATCTGTNCPATISSLAATGPRSDGSTVLGWYPNSLPLDPDPRTLRFTYQAQINSRYANGDDVELLDEFDNHVEVLWNNVDRVGPSTEPSTAAQPEYDGVVEVTETITYNRPILAVAKTNDAVEPLDLTPGTVINYTVTVTNNGQMDAQNVTFIDTIGNRVRGTVTPGSVLIDGVACGDCVIDPVARTLTGTIAGPIAPGDSATVTYEVVPDLAIRWDWKSAGLQNTFSLPSYEDPSGNTYTENPLGRDVVNFGFPELQVVKSIPAQGSWPRYLASSLLGTEIVFHIEITNTGDGTLYNRTGYDTPPDGLCYVDGSVTNGVAYAGTDWWGNQGFTIPGTVAPGASFGFDLTYEVCDTVPIDEQVFNTMRIQGADAGGTTDPSGQRYEATDTAGLFFREPTVAVTKTPDFDHNATVPQTDLATHGGVYMAGEWRIEVRNTGRVTAVDISVDDPMPETLEYSPTLGPATVTFIGGTGPHTLTDNSATDAAAGTVTDYFTGFHGVIDRLDPGQRAIIRVPFIQNGLLPADLDLELVNEVRISNPSLAPAPDHVDDGVYTIIPLRPGPTIEKLIDIPAGVPGTDVVYTLRVTFPDDALADGWDVMIEDRLPDGLRLRNEPAIGPLPTTGGWSVSCVSGPCATTIEAMGDYLGSVGNSGFNGTRMYWWFGDVDFDPGTPIVVDITFEAEVELTYASGFDVIDGVNEPLINWVRPLMNDVDKMATGTPAAIPGLREFDYRFRRSTVAFDVSTPSLRLGKFVTVDGTTTTQVNTGDRLDYELTVTNVGSADAHVVTVNDNLGLGRLRPISGTGANPADWNLTAPAGWTCSIVGTPATIECLSDAGTSIASHGGAVTFTYSAYPVDSSQMLSNTGTPWDPDMVINTATTPSYYGVASPGAGDYEYSFGEVQTATWIFTPQPETEVGYSECPSSTLPGGSISALAWFGNGDARESPNDGDLTLYPWPDLDENPDAGMGFDPIARVTLPASVTFEPGQVTATGAYTGDPANTTWVAFPDPDTVTNNPDGTTTLEWNTLADFPHSYLNDSEYDFIFELRLDIGITVDDPSGNHQIRSQLDFLDGDGNHTRSDDPAVNNPWTYREIDIENCPGGPTFDLAKTPDQHHGIKLYPGDIHDFTITLHHSQMETTNLSFIDLLPSGLTYLGADPGDPDYAVATIDPPLPGGAVLQDYYQTTTTLPSDIDRILWQTIPVLPADTYTITLPFRVEDPALHPATWHVNSFIELTDQGTRQDTGAIYVPPAVVPTVSKVIDHPVGRWGDTFGFEITVIIPADYAGTDILVVDRVNQPADDPGSPLTSVDHADWPHDGPAAPNFHSLYSQPTIQNPIYLDASGTPVGEVQPIPGACYQGCTFGGADDIVPITATVYQDLSLTHPSSEWYGRSIAWYLGDIEPDPEGQDRYLKFYYTADTADFQQLRTWLSAEVPPVGSPYPQTSADYGDISTDTALASQVWEGAYPNSVQITDPGTNRTEAQWISLLSSEVHGQNWGYYGDTHLAANILAVDWLEYRVQFPWVEMDKECVGLNGHDFVPEWTPIGTANVECTITVENTSIVDAYNIRIDDMPDAEGEYGRLYSDGRWGATLGTFATPVSAVSFFEGAPFLTSAPADYPTSGATWEFDLDGGQTVELVYQFRIDGWTDLNTKGLPGAANVGYWEQAGRWWNTATIHPWQDALVGGNTIGAGYTDQEMLQFEEAGLNLAKRPFVPDILLTDPADRWPLNGWVYETRIPSHYSEPFTDPPTTDILEPLTRHALFDGVTLWRGESLGPGRPAAAGCSGVYRRYNCDSPTAWGDAWMARVDEPYSYLLALSVASLDQFSEFELVDALPYGWEYVPGSSRLVAGNWNWPNPSELDPAGTGYTVVPLNADPVVAPPPVGASCASSAASDTDSLGESLTWNFLQGDPTWGQIWDVQYLDSFHSGVFPGRTDHVLLMYDAVPTVAAGDCATLAKPGEPGMFRNSASVTGFNETVAGGLLTAEDQIVTPLLVPWILDKTPDNGFVADGSTDEYVISFENLDEVDLTDVTFTDTLSVAGNGVPGTTPNPYVCGTATATGGTGFVESSCVHDGATSSVTVVWEFTSIAVGETVEITMPVEVRLDEVTGVTYPNTVTVSSPGMWVDLSDEGLWTVVSPSPPSPWSKTGSPDPATINDEIRYTFQAFHRARTAHLDLYYLDTIPDGLTFTGYEPVSCAAGVCPVPMDPVVNPDGTTTIGWWFGDMYVAADTNFWMRYTTVVDDPYVDGSPVVDGDVLTNTVTGYSNDIDVLPDDPMTTIPSDPVSDYTNSRSHALAVVEPVLEYSKSAVSDVTPPDGTATLTYTVSVTNTGGGTAYDLRLTDTPNAALENVVMNPTTYPGSVVVDGWTAIDPELGWYLPVLGAGDTAVFTYTAEIIDTYATDEIFVAENTVVPTTYRARNVFDPEPGDRVYGDLDPITHQVPLDAAIIDIEKSSGGCAAEVGYTSEVTDHQWCLVITNMGTATARTPQVVDVLPTGWSYTAGSTTWVGQATAEPGVVTNANGLEVLSWNLADMAAGDTVTITFDAQAAVGSPEYVTNEASVVIFDQAGDPFGTEVFGARDADVADASLKPFAMEIAKTTDAFGADTDGPDNEAFPYALGTVGPDDLAGTADDTGVVGWTITVTNPIDTADGIDNSLSSLVVTDCLPAPLIYVPGTATSTAAGFAETSVTTNGCGGDGTEIVWSVPALAEGASFTISLPTHTPATGIVEGDEYVNDVQVVSAEIGDEVANHSKAWFYVPNSLGDYTWLDSDGDGRQDAGEAGLDGVIVELYAAGLDGSFGTADDVLVATTVTGDDPATTATTEVGWYRFGGLVDGEYQVEFGLDPANPAHDGLGLTWHNAGSDDTTDSDADRTTGRSDTVDLDSAGVSSLPVDDPTIDAGYNTPINSLGDYVWADVDANGQQDTGEPGVDGVTVTLLAPDGTLLATTTTDTNGAYGFTGLPDGEYIVEFTAPTGQSFTFADIGADGTDSDADRASGRSGLIDLDSAGASTTPVTDVGVDAGLVTGDNAVGDHVWFDTNANGQQDSTEAGVDGVTVRLMTADGTTVLATTTTGDDPATTATTETGWYGFTGLPDGAYIIEFVAPPDQTFTFTNVGDDTSDSDADRVTGRSGLVDLDSAQATTSPVIDPTIDAGLVVGVNTLGDHVWFDTDADGQQDVGEPSVDGVTVNLLDSTGTTVLATTTTDIDGTYAFTGLPDGEYVVEFTAPDGQSFTFTDIGADDTDSDADRTNGRSGLVDLDSAGATTDPVADSTLDAGLVVGINSLGDYVWFDADGDGQQDTGEPGINGVTVRLLDPTGTTVLATTTTSASPSTGESGWYAFADLPDGEYIVEFVAPTGQTFTFTNVGDDDTTDSDADRTTGRTNVIDLDSAGASATAVHDPTIDAGLVVGPNSLGDHVWFDADGDGQQDAGEAGVDAVTVNLLDATGTTVLDSTTTDTNGTYGFTGLPDGEYIVEFIAPTGQTFTFTNIGDTTSDSDADRTTGHSAIIDLDSAGASTVAVDDPTIDAGLVIGINTISDLVWADTDGDGQQDGTETGVDGVTVNLLDATGTTVLAATTTDIDGNYAFTGLPDGEYIIEFVAPTGQTFTFPNTGTDTTDSDADRTTGRTNTIDLDSTSTSATPVEDSTVDAGLVVGINSLGDHVWFDADGDGQQDTGETGVDAVTVNLLDATGSAVLATTTTDIDGNYAFTGLPDGQYVIEFVAPTDQTFTFTDVGADTTDSDADRTTGRTNVIDLDSGGVSTAAVHDPTIDAGLVVGPNSLGDHVWFDADRDGQQDAGETGVDTVTVNLLDATASAVLATTTTDIDGNYAFTNLPDGQYVIEFIAPTNQTFTFPNIGGDDTTDSDADRTTGQTSVIDLDSTSATTTAVDDLSVDAGLVVGINSLGDYVWFDTNSNGRQDGLSEPGINSIIVNLFDATGTTMLATTTTSASPSTGESGWYAFADLPDGEYIVEFVAPAGQTFTFTNVGDDDTIDSDADRTTGRTTVIDLDSAGASATAVIDPTIDAGLLVADNSLGDYVWFDTNGDGQQDGTEAGVDAVTVNLLDATGTTVLATTTTGDDPATTATIEQGWYGFGGLPDGAYIVEFVAPTGNVFTFTNIGDTTTDSDADRVTGRSGLVDLDSVGISDVPVVDPTIDAGLVNGPNSISDTVWADTNNNGQQDTGEGGIDGVTVNLLDSTGTTVLDSTTTDADGNYAFTNLPDGEYIIEFVAPTGQVFTFANVGDDTTDSDADRTTGRSSVIDLDSVSASTVAVHDSTIDAGLVDGPNSTGDTVWADTNNNGQQDTGETGVHGVTVNLLDATGTTVLESTTTDTDGNYTFTGLPDGQYVIEFIAPTANVFTFTNVGNNNAADSNADRSTGRSGVIDLDPTSATDTPVADTTIDAGLVVGENTVGQFVWFDTNGDGQQDTGEPGVNDVTVTLLDPTGTVVLATTTTGDNPDSTETETGWYTFDHLPDGHYTIMFTPPPDHTLTFTNVGDTTTDSDPNRTTGHTARISLDPDATTTEPITIETINAGIIDATVTASLGDTVWYDTNTNGQQDNPDTEPGIQDITVNLLSPTNTILATTITDTNGTYAFTNLPPGDYHIKVINPPGSTFTTPNTTTDDLDSDIDPTTGQTITVTTLAAGEHNPHIDAGLYQPASVGDQVWEDHNRNGIQDPGEPGIKDVTIDLNNTTTGETLTTTTDANGRYSFTDLTPGTYELRINPTTLPDGYWPTTTPPDCDCPDQDHDATTNPNGVMTTEVTLTPGQTHTAIDFGAYPVEFNLTLAKTVDQPDPNQARWELTATNHGPTIAPGPITITDELPTPLTYQSHTTPAGWNCTIDAQTITCTTNQTLTVGESATIDIITTVDPDHTNTITNQAIIENDNPLITETTTTDNNDSAQIETTPPTQPLAFTGTTTTHTLAIATMLVAVGSALLLIKRRRRHTTY